MNRKFLDFAIFFDDDMDGTLWTGQRCKGEFDDGSSAFFFAKSEALVNWRCWTIVLEGRRRKDDIRDGRFLES